MKKDVDIIILIVLDTLRSDHLGCYGYELPTSPSIDQFAKETTLYRYAFSTGSYTVPVHASLLTGKYPSNHSLFFRQSDGELNAGREITLAEILRSRRFRTAAFVSSCVLRKEVRLNTGFDVYDDRMTRHEANRPEALIRDGYETNRAFFDFAKSNSSKRCFYFLHYFDIHGPYTKEQQPKLFPLTAYGKIPQPLEKAPDGFPGGIPEYQLLRIKRDTEGNLIDYEKDRRFYLAQYDRGIRYCDEVIGELFEWLRENELYERAMILVTADHGEALGENDVHFFHGLTVSPEQIRVPLIVKYPDSLNAGGVVEVPVSHVDLLPTVLDCAGLDQLHYSFDGVSLKGGKERFMNRWIVAENQWQRAILRGRHLLLSGKRITYSSPGYYFPAIKGSDREAFYDYVSDPTCKNNLIQTCSEVEEFLRFKSFLTSFVDPKEETIAERDASLDETRRELEVAKGVANSVLHSWSWRIRQGLRKLYGTLFRK